MFLEHHQYIRMISEDYVTLKNSFYCSKFNHGLLNSTQMEMHKRNSKTLTFQQKESAKQSKSAKENNAFSLPHPQRKYQTLQQHINSISYSREQEGFCISGGALETHQHLQHVCLALPLHSLFPRYFPSFCLG